MKFIASIIIFYFLFRLFSKVVVRLLTHQVKKASGMNGNEESRNASPNNSRKKIIPKDEGDYVEFEEIKKDKD
ncbi:MAG: DUF4834 family protein [Bacteroidales bacterium]|nr:DUF4834 family protein [Bacteroidales bacterium]